MDSIRYVTVLVVLAVVASCSGDSTGTPSGVTGRYMLVSYDGKALPAVAYDSSGPSGGPREEIIRGSLTLSGATYIDSIFGRTSFIVTGRPPISVTDFIDVQTGSYTRSGPNLVFAPNPSPKTTTPFVVALNGTTITIGKYVYTK